MPQQTQTKETKEDKKLHIEVVRQMITLSSSGFGLVAALAWNNVIQEITNSYIKKFMPAESSVISLLVYAIVITCLAVVVTLQLSHLLQRLEQRFDKTNAC